MPDTAANLAEFPKPGSGENSPFPQARVVALSECGAHAVVAAAIGCVEDGERQLAEEVLHAFAPGMLVLADRGFYSYRLWREVLATGAQAAFRVAKTVHLPVLEVLPDGSYLSEVHLPNVGKARIDADRVEDVRLATHARVRVVEYTVDTTDKTKTRELFRVITSVLDPDELHAMEIVYAYKERWELELSFREIECQIRPSGATLRSKSPAMVRQEIWGLLIAHYAIRAFMVEAADTIDIDPDRISMTRAINIIHRSVTDPAAFPPSPETDTI